MRDSTKQIWLRVAGCIFAYVMTMATPPMGWWAWVLSIANLGANIVNTLTALFNSTVTDARAERMEAHQPHEAVERGKP